MSRDEAAALTEAIAKYHKALVDESDPQRFVEMLLVLRDVKAEVNQIVREADHLALDLVEGSKHIEIGRYSLEARWSKSRRYSADDNDRLRSDVARIARFDPETGEERSTEEAIRIWNAAFRCGGAEARSTWMKQHDLDPDEYGQGEWKGSVAITPIDVEERRCPPEEAP